MKVLRTIRCDGCGRVRGVVVHHDGARFWALPSRRYSPEVDAHARNAGERLGTLPAAVVQPLDSVASMTYGDGHVERLPLDEPVTLCTCRCARPRKVPASEWHEWLQGDRRVVRVTP